MWKKILFAGLILAGTGLALPTWAADYSSMSTEELAAMRGTMQTAPEPEQQAFRAEWQKRLQSMPPEERRLYSGRPDSGLGSQRFPGRPQFGSPAPLAPPVGIPDRNREELENGFGAPYGFPGGGGWEEERRRYEEQRRQRGLWDDHRQQIGPGYDRGRRLEIRDRRMQHRSPSSSRMPDFGNQNGLRDDPDWNRYR